MNSNINTTKNTFDKIKHFDEDSEEFWYARELMSSLGYESWENFHKVIKRAKVSMSKTYPQVEEHFREVMKKYKIAAGQRNEAEGQKIDYMLTRYACYLIAQNGDPTKKEQIALAQSYFAIQTRKQELEEEKDKAIERILARRKLRETEKKFSGVLNERGLNRKDIAEIRSAGDEALFDMTTREIKRKLGIKSGSLADRLPTITIKAKDLATEITTFNTKEKDLKFKISIKNEHQDNNSSVRKLLNEKGIYPEKLAPEIDINKLERRIPEDEITKKKTNDFIGMDELMIDIRGIVDQQELLRIKDVLQTNNGNTTLKIIYGSDISPKMLIREVAITRDLVNRLKKYLVLE